MLFLNPNKVSLKEGDKFINICVKQENDYSVCIAKKNARNFSPIFLSHYLDTSLKQNHKKFGGHRPSSEDMIFGNLTWGLMGISTSWLFKKNRLKIFG